MLGGTQDDMATGYGPSGRAPTSTLWRGFAGYSPEMADAQEQVAADQVGRMALLGRSGSALSALLARLRDEPAIPLNSSVGFEGFFTLVQLPAQTPAPANQGPVAGDEEERGWGSSLSGGQGEDPLPLLLDADLLVYVFRVSDGWTPADAHWIARLRTTRAPVAPVVQIANDDSPAAVEALAAQIRTKLGVSPVQMHDIGAPEEVTHLSPDADLLALMDRILSLRPRLAIPLAQESPLCRRWIAQRVIRGGAWMTGLLGAEPLPLLDLPLHVAVQWKVALQLAAIYGRPGLDYRSREMVGALAMGVLVRHGAQQLLKLLPLVGWLLSGLVSGLSTWLLGTGLVRYYEQEEIFALPETPVATWKAGIARTWQTTQANMKERWPRRRPADVGADMRPQTIPVTSGAEETPMRRPYDVASIPPWEDLDELESMVSVADEGAIDVTDATVDELVEERTPQSRNGDRDDPFRF